MLTSLVNSLTLLGATLACLACTNARADRSEAEASTNTPSSSTATPDASGSTMGEATQSDSITKAADLGRIQGNPSAALWVIEISDLQCPFCKEWHTTTFSKLRDEFIKTGKVRFAYLNFPLAMHSNAMPAARAAMCASVQGKFWEMQDAIFESQSKWEASKTPEAFFEGLAKTVGLDVAGWKSCIASKSIQALIDADRARVKKQGVGSTPSFMIGGRLVEGMVPYDEMRKMINAALEKK